MSFRHNDHNKKMAAIQLRVCTTGVTSCSNARVMGMIQRRNVKANDWICKEV